MDGTNRCIAETGGTQSFAYVDVPANNDVTVFCSFWKSAEEWDTIYKMSDFHTFDFAMSAYLIDDTNYWDTIYKVTLTPDMFGYVQ